MYLFAAATQISLPFNPADYVQYILPVLTIVVTIAHLRGYNVPFLSFLLDALSKKPQPMPAMFHGEASMPMGLAPKPSSLPPATIGLHRHLDDHGTILNDIACDVRFMKRIVTKQFNDQAQSSPAAGAPPTDAPICGKEG